jgi:hypothetical protein
VSIDAVDERAIDVEDRSLDHHGDCRAFKSGTRLT